MNALPGVLMVLAGSLLEGVAQVCFKRAASEPQHRLRWLAPGILLALIEIGLYTRALKSLPISAAYPLSALSYAAVVLAARVLLGEQPSRRRWLGIALIVAGAACALPES